MKKRTRSIAAVLMAVLMTVGLIPADFTLVKAKAGEVKKVFNANDTTLTWSDSKASVGDFTVDANTDTTKVTIETLAADKQVTHTIDGETLTFTKWMKFNSDNPIIKFNVSSGATATVRVLTQANGNGKYAAIKLDDVEKHITDKVTLVEWKDLAEGPHTIISSNATSEVDETKLEGGTKADVTVAGRAKPKFFYIEIVETTAGGGTSTTDKTFNANDTTLTWSESKASVGDDGYFTVNANTDTTKVTIETLATDKQVTHTIDGEALTFTKWMKFNSDNPIIEFNVSPGATATVKVLTQANGNGKYAAIKLDDVEKHITDKVTLVEWKDLAEGPHTIISSNATSEVDETKLEGGTKADVTVAGRAKPKFFYIKVTETSGSAATGTAPVISSATAKLKDGTDDTVVISWVESTAAEGDGEVIVEAIKDGGTPAKVKLSDENKTSKSVEYKVTSSGNYTFKVYGKLGGTSTQAAETSVITYKLPLAKPVVTAKAGDAKVDISWKEVKEATGYKVTIKNGAATVKEETVDAKTTSYSCASTPDNKIENLTTYTVTVTVVRAGKAGEETAVSDEVSVTPYEPRDTSKAVPGMVITDQSKDDAVSISRTGGKMSFSQTATSGGPKTNAIENSSFVLTEKPIDGPFTMTADITYYETNSSTSGLFFGAFTGSNADSMFATIASRGSEFNARRTKTGTQGSGGSGKGKYDVGVKYSVSFSRSADKVFSYTIKKGEQEVANGNWPVTDVHEKLQDPVYAGFLISGTSADVENMKITKGDDTVVFDSNNLTGEFNSFQPNWDKVKAPVISVEGAKDKMVVTSNCEISPAGAGTVTVIMKDKDGKEVSRQSSSKTGSSQTFEFAPEASGKYTFVAEASRPSVETVKTSNEVSVDNFVATLKEPQGLTATSQGGGSVQLQWNAYGEATGWKVRYKAANGDWSEYVTVADPKTTSYMVKGLTVGTKYTFEVVTVRGAEEKAATAEATATADSKFRWQFSAYGSSMSTKPEDTGYLGDANDGSVQVWNLNGKGKVVPNSTDGLAFYYTQIPTASNFILKAKVHVDQWTLSNGQDGFGLMVADRVGVHGDSTNFWNNSYQAIASKVEYFVDEETKEISDAGKKISMKLGLGVTAKTGVNKENLDRLNASDTATVQNEFKTETVPLDTSAMNLEAGTYNVIPESTNTAVTEGLSPVQDYYITIQKNNTGYFVTYSDTNGNPIRTQKYYDTKAMSMVDEDYVYAGFFASRNAKATFSDISLELRDPADDPAPEEKPIKYVTPRYSVTSPKATGIGTYEFVFTTTASGILSVDGLAGVYDIWVEAGEKFTKTTNLHRGANYFGITFTPDPDFVPENGDRLTSYEQYYFEHVVSYNQLGHAGESIWVSPTGDPNSDGNVDSPVDIYTAVKYVQPGQQIILKGGTYKLDRTVNTERGNDGSAGNMIYMIADPNAKERPVLDFQWSCPGMVLAGDYWYFKGFDVTHSANAQKGVQVSGNNNVLDQINAYHNGNTGIQISRLLSTDLWDDWPANNLILNCTSYGNADKGYEDADGFAAKLTIADGNVFDGCIAYNNADDGWDLFAKVETGSIGSVTIRNCVAYGNGYLEDGTNAGNGNGFKMGGDSLSGKHHLINSIAYNNKAKGIDSNSCPDIQVTSSTTFNNESYNVAFYTNTAANTDYVADGILSFRTEKLDQEEQLKPKGSQVTGKYKGTTNYYWDAAKKQSVNTADAAASADWFVSLDTSVAPTRNADGTINMHGLLQLTDLAPEGVGARFEPTKSKDIVPLPSVWTEPDVKEESTKAPETPGVTDGLNVIGQNISVQAPAGTVIKNAAGQVITAGKVFVKAAPVAANAADAAAILEVMKTDEIKIADNAGVDYFDVKLVDEAGNPLTFEGSIIITFAYPKGTNASSHAFTVLHLLANGKLDVMQPAVSDAGISVSVTELSPFAVVYAAKSADGSGSTVISAATGDRTPIVPIIVILVASAIIICAGVIISKKRKA